jgi:hypothetical protein
MVGRCEPQFEKVHERWLFRHLGQRRIVMLIEGAIVAVTTKRIPATVDGHLPFQ